MLYNPVLRDQSLFISGRGGGTVNMRGAVNNISVLRGGGMLPTRMFQNFMDIG